MKKSTDKNQLSSEENRAKQEAETMFAAWI